MNLSYEQEQLLKDHDRLNRMLQSIVTIDEELAETNRQINQLSARAKDLQHNAPHRKREATWVQCQIASLREQKGPLQKRRQDLVADKALLKQSINNRSQRFQRMNQENPDQAESVRLLRALVRRLRSYVTDDRIELSQSDQQLLSDAEVCIGDRAFDRPATTKNPLRPIEPQLRQIINQAMSDIRG